MFKGEDLGARRNYLRFTKPRGHDEAAKSLNLGHGTIVAAKWAGETSFGGGFFLFLLCGSEGLERHQVDTR